MQHVEVTGNTSQ